MEMTKELLAKAKKAENAEALRALAKENGWDMTQEEGKAYFTQLHKTGAISDEELENVTGGGCKNNGHTVVSALNLCDYWQCKIHGESSVKRYTYPPTDLGVLSRKCYWCSKRMVCHECAFCRYENGLWLCYNTKKNGQ